MRPAFLFLMLLACPAFALGAQQAPPVAGTKVPTAPTVPKAAGITRSDAGVVVGPPISPKRAFLYSFFVPGAGQAALDRYKTGGFYFLAEGLALALVHRSAEDLRVARQFRGDSVPATYQTDPLGQPLLGGDGRPQVATWKVNRYSAALVRARRTHYEDWLAVVVFNHLFSGADAFVAAQLWDLPARIGTGAAPDGSAALVASISFR